MNTIYDFFSTDWAYAFGWTLMHSIWQSLLIFIILMVCLHFISPMLSKWRYALTCGALVLTLFSSTITFLYSINHSVSHATVRNAPSGNILSIKIETEKAKTNIQKILHWAYQGLNENMPINFELP